MNYSRINKDYLIRINNPEHNYKGLLSAKNFFFIVNEGGNDSTLAERIIERVQKSQDQKIIIKLRRGIVFEFIYR